MPGQSTNILLAFLTGWLGAWWPSSQQDGLYIGSLSAVSSARPSGSGNFTIHCVCGNRSASASIEAEPASDSSTSSLRSAGAILLGVPAVQLPNGPICHALLQCDRAVQVWHTEDCVEFEFERCLFEWSFGQDSWRQGFIPEGSAIGALQNLLMQFNSFHVPVQYCTVCKVTLH